MSLALLLFGLLFFFMFLGMPIAIGIELANISFLSITGVQPLIVLVQRIITGINSFTLLAVPMFIMMGYIMEQSGLSERLVNWVSCLFGHIKGSTGIITIITCTIFGALIGNGPATVCCIGAIMFPALQKAGYSRGASAAIICAGGCLGPMIPPSTGLVIYGAMMGLNIPELFLAIVGPGILIAIGYLIVNAVFVRVKNIPPVSQKYTLKEKLILTFKAIPTLMLPIIILGGIYSGIFTPTEAGCIGCAYALILSLFFKTISLKNVKEIFAKTAESSGSCLMIVGMSNLFSYILSLTGIPVMISNAAVSVVHNQVTYLLILFLLMLLVGCVMEGTSAMLIIAPIIIPIGTALGLGDIHLAIAFCANLNVGILTPPFGMSIFTTCSTTGVPYGEIVRNLIPYVAMAIFVILLTSLIPGISTFLPNLVYG